MAKHPLMIVESITKSKTISKLLGQDITVKASIGHICDLPNGKDLGVDLAHDFTPHYVLTPQGQRVIRELRAEAKKAEQNIHIYVDYFTLTEFDQAVDDIQYLLCESSEWRLTDVMHEDETNLIHYAWEVNI